MLIYRIIPRIIKYLFIALSFAFVIAYIGKWIMQSDTPDFLDKIVENNKKDVKLMNQIGGYKTFQYSYQPIDSKEDSVSFEIIIYGYKKDFIYQGESYQLENGDWRIINTRTDIKNK